LNFRTICLFSKAFEHEMTPSFVTKIAANHHAQTYFIGIICLLFADKQLTESKP